MVYMATFEEIQSIWQPEPTGAKKLIFGEEESSRNLGRGGLLCLQKLLQIGVVMCFLIACCTVSFFHNKEFIPVLLKCSWGLAMMEEVSNDEAFWCDRRSNRSDVCFAHGDVLLHTRNVSDVVLRTSSPESAHCQHVEVVRPYTRKWEPITMASVAPVTLRIDAFPNSSRVILCDVQHSVPAVLFSIGGFTGNPYHDFQDVLIPLFITSQHWKGEVIFVVSDVRWWWIRRWADVLQQLSKYPIVYTENDTRNHCFPEMTVGLHIHKELGIDTAQMPNGESMKDFQDVLQRALGNPCLESDPRNHFFQSPLNINSESTDRSSTQNSVERNAKSLKLLIVSRSANRVLLNQKQIIKMAKSLNFETNVLTPTDQVELPKIYSMFHDSDVVMGVHGAGLAHIVFMKRGAVLLQIVPLGTDWPSDHYYKQPAMELELQYLEYKIQPSESSLSKKYGPDHPVVRNPHQFTSEGWATIKQLYLSNQNVRPNLKRLRDTLVQAKGRALAASVLTPEAGTLACL